MSRLIGRSWEAVKAEERERDPRTWTEREIWDAEPREGGNSWGCRKVGRFGVYGKVSGFWTVSMKQPSESFAERARPGLARVKLENLISTAAVA